MDEGVLQKVCKFLKKQEDNEAVFSVFWEGTKDLYPDGLSKNKVKAWLKEHRDRFEIIAKETGDPFGKIKLKVQATGVVLPSITKAEEEEITRKLVQCIDNKEENGHLFAIICKNKAQIFPEKLQDKKYIRKWLAEHENYFKMVNDVNGGLHSVEVKAEARNLGKRRPLPPAARPRTHSKATQGESKPPKTENTDPRSDLLKLADDMELRISLAIQKNGGTIPLDTLLKANDVIYPLTDEESLRVFLSHFSSKFEIINIQGIGEWVHLRNTNENEVIGKVTSFIFEKGGTVPFVELQNHAARLIGGNINSPETLVGWLKTKASHFEIVPKSDDPSKPWQVRVKLAFSPRFCHNYVANGQCEKKHCQFLHICKAYVCQPLHGDEVCMMSHNIRDSHNKLIVDKLGALSKETDNVVVEVLRKSCFPRVCSDYNKNGKCPRGEKCHFLHICGNYVLDQCSGCSLSHNITDGLHNIQLLKRYSLLPSKNMSLEIVKTNIAYAQVKKPQPDQKVEVKEKKKRQRPCRRKRKSDKASSTVDDTSSAETDSYSGDFDNNSIPSSSQKANQLLLSSDNIQKSNLATSLTGYQKVENWMGGPLYHSQAPNETCDNQSDSSSAGSDISFQSSVSSTQSLWQDDLQKRVFVTILEKYDGNVPFSKIVKEKDLFGSVVDAVKWFQKHQQKFLLHRNGQGKIDTISSFSSKARICLDYSRKRGCNKPSCGFFHICRGYVEGHCLKEDKCPLNHDVKSEQVSPVAKRIGLQDLSHSQLLTLIRVSAPTVCHYHNQGGCNRGVFCPNLHVCKAFVKGNHCKGNETCRYGHKQALKQEPAKKILKMYHLYGNEEPNDKKLKYIQRMIFVFDTRKQRGSSQRKSVREQPEVQDENEATDESRVVSGLMDVDLTAEVDSPAQEPEGIVPSICHKFVTGKCRQRKKCSNVHFSLPYLWQFKFADSTGSKWENFDVPDCENIEKYFCDEKCNATELSISTKITEDMSSIRVDFQSMSGHRQASSKDDFKIRRLECLGKDHHENEAWCQTKWMWYKFDTSRWTQCEYNKVNVYEAAFLDGMLKVDWSTWRRRPSGFLTESQVVEKKRETKEQQMSEEPATPTPSVANESPQPKPDTSVENISSPAVPVNCYRTRVEPGTPNYTKVESLCNFSGRTDVTVKQIERVHSDVLSNKYASKRKSINDKLLPGELPNERHLFVPCLNEDIERIMNGNIGQSRIVLPQPFGRGYYFTSDASLCLRWCREHAIHNSQYSLIVCQVLLGASTQGTRYLTEFPRQSDGRFYDSLVDALGSPTVFMIKDVDQCYPTFIIDFSYTPTPVNEVEQNLGIDEGNLGLTTQPQHTYPHVSQVLPTYHRESPRLHASTHPLGTSYTSQSTNVSSVLPQQPSMSPNIPTGPVDYVKACPQPPPYSERSDPPPAYTAYPQPTREAQADLPRARNVMQTPAPRQSGNLKDDKCLVM